MENTTQQNNTPDVDAAKVANEIKSIGGVANEAKGAVDSLKTENEKLQTEVKSLTDANVKLEGEIKTVQKNLDDAKTEFKSWSAKQREPKSPWGKAVDEIIEQKQAIVNGNKIELEVKDVTYGTGNAARVPMEERIADIKVDPHYMTAIRNHIPVKPTSAGSVRFNRRDAIASSSSPVAGTAQNQDASARVAFSDYSPVLQNIEQDVITYGAISTINEEQLDDVLGLQSFLSNDLLGFAMDRENLELLQGTDSSTSLASFNSEGTAWVDQRPMGEAAVLRANFFDVLINGIAQLAANNYVASKIFLTPASFWSTNFALAKSTQGEYVYRQMMETGKAFLGGAELVITPAVTGDNFYIISQGSCALHTREGFGVEFYRQNDDFARNNISVRIKSRSAHTIYLPGGIVRGDFSAAVAELNAPQA